MPRGLKTVGGGATIDLARRPAIIEAGGLRIAVLGYSDVRPARLRRRPRLGRHGAGRPVRDRGRRRRRAAHADLVVVWFHWGHELEESPNGEQQALATAALAAGASVVLGAHPHVLQPVTRQGHKLVAWSLGNFVFPSGQPQTRNTGVLLATLDANGVTGFRLARATIHGFRPELDASARPGSSEPERGLHRVRAASARSCVPSVHVTYPNPAASPSRRMP